MIPLSTVKLLRQWAAWGQGQSIDYPSMSPMFGERALKTPLYGVGHVPDGIAEMEAAVCRLEFDQRYIIIQKWQRHRNWTELSKMIGVSSWRVRKLLQAAEAEAHRQLEQIYCAAQMDVLHKGRLNNCQQSLTSK